MYKELCFDDLEITLREVYEAMQYGESIPDELSRHEIDELLEEIRTILRPRLIYITKEGELADGTLTLSDGTKFEIGKIISRQLKNSESFVFFICTAGREYMEFQERIKASGDIFKLFAVDSIGSVLAEKCADEMELFLEDELSLQGLFHTNRFSPGYCGWNVSQQQLLFPLFEGETCGVTLTPSSLMIPIKSVSGVIGIGHEVKKLDYTCRLCSMEQCFRRRLKK